MRSFRLLTTSTLLVFLLLLLAFVGTAFSQDITPEDDEDGFVEESIVGGEQATAGRYPFFGT